MLVFEEEYFVKLTDEALVAAIGRVVTKNHNMTCPSRPIELAADEKKERATALQQSRRREKERKSPLLIAN